MEWLIAVVSGIRSVRTEMNVPAGAKIPLRDRRGRASKPAPASRASCQALMRLARLESVDYATDVPSGSAQIVLGEATFALPLAGVIDIDAERARLDTDIAKEDGRDRQDRQEARQRAVRRQGQARSDRGAAHAPRRGRRAPRAPRRGAGPAELTMGDAVARPRAPAGQGLDERHRLRRPRRRAQARATRRRAEPYTVPQKGFVLVSGNAAVARLQGLAARGARRLQRRHDLRAHRPARAAS